MKLSLDCELFSLLFVVLINLHLTGVPKSVDTVMKLLDFVHDRAKWGDENVLKTCTVLLQSGKTAEELMSGWYHRHCYRQFAHKTDYERCRKRYEAAAVTGKFVIFYSS